jgi:hypothetical protein
MAVMLLMLLMRMVMMVVMVLLRSEKAISRNQREKDICNTEYYWKVSSGQRAIESKNSIGYHKKKTGLHNPIPINQQVYLLYFYNRYVESKYSRLRVE